MNTPPVCGGAPEWLRALAAARTHYEEMFGWPVAIKVEQQALVAPVGGVLNAVSMPATLAEKVLTDLQLMRRAGPVVALPDNSSWTFFTQPVVGPVRDVPGELRHLVQSIPKGSHVVIPTRVDSVSELRWIKQPQPHRRLPPWSVVVGIACRVATSLITEEAVRTGSGIGEERQVPLAS